MIYYVRQGPPQPNPGNGNGPCNNPGKGNENAKPCLPQLPIDDYIPLLLLVATIIIIFKLKNKQQ